MASSQAITQSAQELVNLAEGQRRQAEQSFGQYALEAGRLLLEAKAKAGHGNFTQLLATSWGGSQRTAEIYMKAFKRYRQLPAREREEVMQQPFTRSLLVVSQAPRATPPARPQLPERSAATNGHTQTPVADTVEEYLKERGLPTEQLETTQLLNAALDFQGQTTTEEDEDLEADTPLIEHEATPLDDILDAPRPATPEVEDSDVVDGISQKEIDAEAVEEYERALNEIARLEDLTRSLTRELQAARTVAEQAVQNAGAAAPQGARGWDYFEQMARYLKADESQRTPESLARRAASLPNDHGREVIAYLSMFLQATLNHMQALG